MTSDPLQSESVGGLKLRAEDEKDLAVVAACLQDAITHVGEMSYLPRKRRFAAVFNRFRWEEEEGGKRPSRAHERVRTGVHFDGVLGVQARGLEGARKDDVLALLTMTPEAGEEGAGTITLVFAGSAEIKLDVECIDCHVADLSPPWKARAAPRHPVEDSGD